MATSCYAQYKACIKKCQPASGYDYFLCAMDCVNQWAECNLPKFSNASVSDHIELIEILGEFNDVIAETVLTSRAHADAMLSQRTVVKPGGISEPFLPNSKLRQRLGISGIDLETTNIVTQEVAMEFKDGQSSEDIRETRL